MNASLRRVWVPLLLILIAAAAALGWWRWRDAAPARGPAGGQAETFAVLDVAERSLDGKPALAVLLSTELDAGRDHDRYLTVFKLVDKSASEVAGGWVLSDDRHVLYFADIEPETAYRVELSGKLPDATGQTLDEDQSFEVTTRKITPAFGFATRGSVLPGRVSEGLPVVTVNVDEVAIEFLRVKDDSLGQFMNNYYWQTQQAQTSADALEDMSRFTESAYYGRFRIQAEPNTRSITHIPVQEIDKLRAPGLYIAVMSRPAHFGWEYETSYFFVSDIGLQARRFDGRLEIYASSLATGKPFDDVELELLDSKGKRVAEAETNRHGHATLDLTLKPEHVLVARAGRDLSLLAFNQPALDLSAFGAAGPPQHALEVFAYGPRDLYRPGETVTVAALLRDHDGRAVPGQPLLARLQRPDGKRIRQFTLEPQALGYYQTELEMPDDVPTGQWALLLYTDPASKQPALEYPFKVEDFMPERMKLTLESGPGALAPGDVYALNIQGDYLYGAPAAGNKVTAVLNVRPEPHPLPELKDFYFGDVNESHERRREELPELRLDEQGHAELRVTPAEEEINSPLAARLTVNLFETGGRPVVRSLTRTVWPAEAMVGIHPLFADDTAPGDGQAEFEFLRVDATGKPAPARGLLVKLVREEREYYWSYDDEAGWREQFSEQQFTAASASLDLSGPAPVKLSFPVDYGRYRLDVHDPQTGRAARYRFYAGWGERDDATGPDRVMLKLDKASYAPGDTVKLEILPPHAGNALLLVEADRTLHSERLEVPAEGKTVKFKIGENWNRHDIYVNVIVLRPGESKSRITPNRALGLIHLPLARADRRLQPVLEAAAKSRPLQPLDVKLRLDGLAGQEAYVTLAAVDVGVLNITAFRTPDPFEHFFRQHRFAADLYDIYGRVIESLEGRRAQLRFGGDEDARGDRSKLGRADVKILSLFNGPVKVGADGSAHVRLDLPDFNGTLRLMALAYAADRFGSAEAEVVVAAPVVAEAATPRFLAPGDRSQLALDLRNLSDRPQTLSVKLDADGPVAVSGGSHSLSLAPGKRAALSIPLTADQAFGSGELRLRVSNQDASDPVRIDRRWTLSVRPAYPGDRRVQWRVLKSGESLALDATLAQGLMPATVDGTLTVSSQAPLNLRDAVQGLLGYPYGCAEQTTSTAFPLIYVSEARARALSLKPLSDAERRKRVDYAFARLAGLQSVRGGFAVWPGENEDPWITPYITDFLLQARDQGFAVPEEMLKKAQDRLLERLQSGSDLAEGRWSQSPAHLGLASKAYAAYVLARLQRAPLGTLRTLYDNHAKAAEGGLPLVQLGLALALQGDKEKGLAAIKAGIVKPYPENRYLGDYGTPLRDDALMLALLLRHREALGGSPPGLDALVLRLGETLRGRAYLSTQERFAIFLAGEALEAEAPKPWRAQLSLGGERRSESVERRLLQAFGMAELRGGIRIVPDAGFSLYAMTDVTGYPAQAPKPRSDVVEIRRGWYGMDGKAIGNRPLKSGEMLLVYLQLNAKERIEDALVTDLVPAGLEVENLNLAQGETLQDVMVEGINPAQAMNGDQPRYQEFRDDRYVAAVRLYGAGSARHLFYLARVVTPGRFHVPPPFVEDMYRPEIFGIGETPAMLEVRE